MFSGLICYNILMDQWMLIDLACFECREYQMFWMLIFVQVTISEHRAVEQLILGSRGWIMSGRSILRLRLRTHLSHSLNLSYSLWQKLSTLCWHCWCLDSISAILTWCSKDAQGLCYLNSSSNINNNNNICMFVRIWKLFPRSLALIFIQNNFLISAYYCEKN